MCFVFQARGATRPAIRGVSNISLTPVSRKHVVNNVVGLVLNDVFFAIEVQVYLVQYMDHGTCTYV